SSFSAMSYAVSGLTDSPSSSCQAAAIPTAPRITPAPKISVPRVIALPPSKVSGLPGSLPALDTKDDRAGSICDRPQNFSPRLHRLPVDLLDLDGCDQATAVLP